MNINMDSLQMITFVTLAREQSFRRAAKVLQVSQPTVTIRIKMLEQNLGIELIQRGGSSISLTASGEKVFLYIERILHSIQEGKDHISSHPTLQKRLSIAAIPSFSTYVFPWMIGAKRMEKVEMTIHTATSNDVLQSLLDGMAQFGVLRGPVKHSQLDSLLLYKEKILLALSPDHPLNEYKQIYVENLLEESFITYPRRFWSFVSNRFLEKSGQLHSSIRVDSEVTAKKMVSSSLGLSFIPELSMRKEGQEGTIVCRSIEDCDIQRDAYLVFPKGGNEEVVAQFYDWVQRSIGDLYN
jgi:DNA-binding transcriptional LysR family regulator